MSDTFLVIIAAKLAAFAEAVRQNTNAESRAGEQVVIRAAGVSLQVSFYDFEEIIAAIAPEPAPAFFYYPIDIGVIKNPFVTSSARNHFNVAIQMYQEEEILTIATEEHRAAFKDGFTGARKRNEWAHDARVTSEWCWFRAGEAVAAHIREIKKP